MILQLSVDSHSVISGIDSTFTFLRQRDIDFYILTNDASRAPLELASAYLEAGLAEVTEEKIISSSMLACEYLRNKIRSGPVAFVGTDASSHYVETAGLAAISIQDLELDDAAEIQALVFLDDEGFHWEKTLNHSVNLLRGPGIFPSSLPTRTPPTPSRATTSRLLWVLLPTW